MYMAPVGVVNAGDPAGAYAEGIEVASAHQSSYGKEAAGGAAAAVAAAFVEGATAESVVAEALAVARDGTGDAIGAVADAARHASDWREAIPRLRAAVEPFDTVGPDDRDLLDDALLAQPDQVDRGPARRARDGPGRRRRLRGRRARCGQLRPRLGLDRQHGRRDLRRPRWPRGRPVRRATRIAEASRTPLEPAGHPPRSRARSSPATPSGPGCASSGVRRCSTPPREQPHLGAGPRPDVPPAGRQRPRGQGHRRGPQALGGGRRTGRRARQRASPR